MASGQEFSMIDTVSVVWHFSAVTICPA